MTFSSFPSDPASTHCLYASWEFTIKFHMVGLLSYSFWILHSFTNFLTVAAFCSKFIYPSYRVLNILKLFYTVVIGLTQSVEPQLSFCSYFLCFPASHTSSFTFSGNQHIKVLILEGSFLCGYWAKHVIYT